MATSHPARVAPTAKSAPPATNDTIKGRRLLGRLTSSWSTKARTVTEFYVRLEAPHRPYSPGDSVSGAIVLTVVKPLRISHLVVCLCGYIRVFKNGSIDDGPALGVVGSDVRDRRPTQHVSNGQVSLFKEEAVLCGEGRLDAGVYEFNFELGIPQTKLPSSIDFERGSISYAVAAVLTRPTSISPTTTCHRKFHFLETIDVARLQQPRSRRITLEPIRRRSKAKVAESKEMALPPRRTSAAGTSISATSSIESKSAEPASIETPTEPNEAPKSPGRSENSGASTRSSSAGSLRTGSRLVTAFSSSRSGLAGSPSTLTDRTISATVELSRSGCLRGDLLPVKIRIRHTKPIKSMHGIIITLYRQGRIDTHSAPLPKSSPHRSATPAKGGPDDIYPKSRTGLGGLSLSASGSSSVFRKDLSQAFAPIIIDPHTLTAEVKASIRVPDDAFPTIACVPGAMISFKYYVEVVMDLNGKLARHDSFLPEFGMVKMSSNLTGSKPPLDRADNSMDSFFAALGGSIIDTDQLRRDKSVVACLFEVLVGTINSARKTEQASSQALKWSNLPTPMSNGDGGRPEGDPAAPNENSSSAVEVEVEERPEEVMPVDGRSLSVAPATFVIPPPDVAMDEPTDEKAIIRRAEERLLPSAPALDDDTAIALPLPVPSAPSMPMPVQPVAPSHRSHGVSISANPADPAGESSCHPVMSAGPSGSEARISDDKHDMEIRRLRGEVSAPSTSEVDDANTLEDDRDMSGQGLQPSAPTLTELLTSEERHNNASPLYAASESLPRYER